MRGNLTHPGLGPHHEALACKRSTSEALPVRLVGRMAARPAIRKPLPTVNVCRWFREGLGSNGAELRRAGGCLEKIRKEGKGLGRRGRKLLKTEGGKGEGRGAEGPSGAAVVIVAMERAENRLPG